MTEQLLPTTLTTPDDTISVSTPPVANRLLETQSKAREYTVKFLFHPSKGNNNTAVVQSHCNILQSISDIYPEVMIYNNSNQSISDFTKVKSYTDYLRHFQLHFIKTNELKKRDSAYIVYHCILSPIPLNEIRHHYAINTLLSKVHTQMTQHFWNEDKTKIANLGFFIGVEPQTIYKRNLKSKSRLRYISRPNAAKIKYQSFSAHFRFLSIFLL